MSIQYTFSSEDELLVITASGFHGSLKEVQEYDIAVAQEILQGSYSLILCDERQIEYRLGTLDVYDAAKFAAHEMPRVKKAALVCDTRFISVARFWETVAVNRCLSVRVFDDLSAARDWLGVPV